MPKALTRQDKQERTRKMIQVVLDNPGITREELAEKLGMSMSTLYHTLNHGNVMAALRLGAHKKVINMIPLAVKGYEDSLKSKNDKIKYLSSKDLLQSEKILGPERVDITVTDNSEKTEEELRELISRAQQIPVSTIDAEIIE